MAAEGDNVFAGVMICFTQSQASSCGADRHPGGNGGRPRLKVRSGLTAVDSIGVTSDEINQLLEYLHIICLTGWVGQRKCR